MGSQQEETEQARKACVLCGNEFPGKLELCPDDGTLLTPIGKEPRVGDIIADRYEILGVLGDGGMGKVYKARHNLMKRVVAIKMLLPHLVQSGPALKRFQQEAQAASALKHPHIMTVHDFGISDKGLPFLVMDYLEGVSLSSVLQELGTVPQDRAVNIFIQACSALSHAHKNGVVHRDLKPANLMLIDFDGQPDFLMVVDFGIAKLLQPDGSGEQLTHTGEVFGSPLYMSPEQCRGKELDPRSDIYSLGCVIYRTLTGRPVFGGRDAMECMFKQVNDMPGTFGDVCPELGLSETLEAAVFKAIAKDPALRFQTMAEFRDALEQSQAPAAPVRRVFSVPPQSGQEVAYDAATDKLRRPAQLAATQLSQAGSPAHPEHSEPPSGRPRGADDLNPTLISGPQAVVPPAVPADAGSGSQPAQSGRGTSQGLTPTGSSPGSITLSANTIPPANQSPGPAAQQSAANSQFPVQGPVYQQSGSGGQSGVQGAQEASALGRQSAQEAPSLDRQSAQEAPSLDRQSARSGRNNSQSDNYSRQIDEPSFSKSWGTGQAGPPKMALIVGGVVIVLLIAGVAVVSMSGTHGDSSASIPNMPRNVDKNSPTGTQLTEAISQIASGKYKNAEQTLSKAVGIAGSDRELAEVLPLQARVYEQSGKYAQAQEAWGKLLSIQEKTGASQPDIARTKSELALPMVEQGNVDEAEPLLNDAEKVLSNAPEADKTGLSHVYYGLSKVALKRGDYNNAVATLLEAVNRISKVEGAGSPELVQLWQDLAEVYLVQGKLVDSEVALDKMLKLAEDRFGKDSAQVADAYKDLGTVYFQKGQLGKSEAFFKKSLAIKSADFGTDSVSAAEVMATLAMLYTREKKYKQAEPLFKHSLDIRTRELGADSKQAKRTRELYATLQKLMKGSR